MWIPSLLLSLLLLPPSAGSAQDLISQGPLQVGEILEASYESAHPYFAPATGEHHLIRSEEIYLQGATYVAPYFSRFELAPGDYVVVRSPSGHRRWRYEGFGKADLGRTGGFWGMHVTGERLVIELFSNGSAGAWGYRVGKVARGFADLSAKAVCGDDDKENARCYEMSDPEIYSQSRAVARLLINGSGLCTGWLVGSEGHVITNNHCIYNASRAMNTDFEFLAEGECGETCPQLGCEGVIAATSSTLVQTSSSTLGLDYSLLKLPVNPTPTYGFFQLRATGPVLGERLYIPQHPGGRGKEIAVVSTDPSEPSGFPELDDIFTQDGSERIFATYFGDTEGGSSGSPVVAHADGCVVVVHSGAFGCGTLGNTGTVINQVIADLGANVPADAVVESGPCIGSPFHPSIFADGFESGDERAWSATIN
jgi:hypothetical protein